MFFARFRELRCLVAHSGYVGNVLNAEMKNIAVVLLALVLPALILTGLSTIPARTKMLIFAGAVLAMATLTAYGLSHMFDGSIRMPDEPHVISNR